MANTRVPLHPLFVHFPIALLGTSLVFDIVGLVRNEPVWWTIAFWNIALGLVVGLVTATTGLLDSLRIRQDSPAAKLVTPHLLSMVAALSCYGIALIVRGGTGIPSSKGTLTTLVLEAVGLVLLIVGGYLGGEMVYRHGVGQMRDVQLPANPPRPPAPKTRVPPAIMPPPRATQPPLGGDDRPPQG